MTIDEFEKSWIKKLNSSKNIQNGSPEIKKFIRSHSQTKDPLKWTCQLMEQLEQEFGTETTQKIMLNCSCQYPKEMLSEAKTNYQQKQNIDSVLQILQGQFVSFLKNSLKLDQSLIDKIIKLGWGLAGVKGNQRIIATKIPKSDNLEAYFKCEDPKQKSALYCHCPRVQSFFQSVEKVPNSYCYCGGGFYKGIWEEILQHPVQIKLLKSLINGDDVCQFEILLPEITWNK